MSDDRTDINFLSVNARGLRNYVKRRKAFNWVYKPHGANSICFIQEAHSDYKTEKSWKHLWRGESFFSHGSTKSCGVITLIGQNIRFKVFDKIIDDKGRYSMLKCSMQGKQFLLINYYAPNIEIDQTKVFGK